MTAIKALAVVVIVGLVIGALAAYELAVWRECRADHPWWYCMRILSK